MSGQARVEHRVVVRERDARRGSVACDVAVERGPAAVAVLHAEQPGGPRCAAGRAATAQARHGAGARQHHRGVVGIRVNALRYSKNQPPGSTPRFGQAPVARAGAPPGRGASDASAASLRMRRRQAAYRRARSASAPCPTPARSTAAVGAYRVSSMSGRRAAASPSRSRGRLAARRGSAGDEPCRPSAGRSRRGRRCSS